jgi:hypothetical protein
LNKEKKQTATHFLAVALLPSHRGRSTSFCNGIRNANADFYIFPAVARTHPYSPEKGLLGLWRLVKTATPPPVRQKKAFYMPKSTTLFLLTWGVCCLCA